MAQHGFRGGAGIFISKHFTKQNLTSIEPDSIIMSDNPSIPLPTEDFSLAEFIKIESIFVRHRNILMVRGQFTPIYTDYYIHLMEQNLRHKEELDQKLKDLMALLG
jgi:hypothetical protein